MCSLLKCECTPRWMSVLARKNSNSPAKTVARPQEQLLPRYDTSAPPMGVGVLLSDAAPTRIYTSAPARFTENIP